MGALKLVCLSLPPEKHAFWAEISAYAREEAEAELALCRLEGRPVMVLSAAGASRGWTCRSGCAT